MTRISNNYNSIPEIYREDVKEIVEACKRRGLIITPEEGYKAWGNYSDSMAAGWMGLPEPFEDLDVTQEDCDKEIERIVEYHNK